MKNELLETYIKENSLEKFEKKYANDFTIILNDGSSTMTLLQLFNFVVVKIDDDFIQVFEKRTTHLGSFWYCVPEKYSFI